MNVHACKMHTCQYFRTERMCNSLSTMLGKGVFVLCLKTFCKFMIKQRWKKESKGRREGGERERGKEEGMEAGKEEKGRKKV